MPPVASVGWTEAVKREFRKENLVYTRDDRGNGIPDGTHRTVASTPMVHMSVEYDIGAKVSTSAEQWSMAVKRTRTVRLGSTR